MLQRAVLLTMVMAVLSPASSSGATLGKCTFAALSAAVAKGGEVRFGCHGAIKFTRPIVVGRAVTLDAAGEDVTLDGRGRNQLFKLQSRARLVLVGLTLTNAKATGAAGRAGINGTDGTNGTDGANGTNGTNGTPESKNGTPGGDGSPGQAGTDGGAGTNGIT